MLQPAGDVLPCLQEFLLLQFADDVGRASHIVISNGADTLHVLTLRYHLVLLCH